MANQKNKTKILNIIWANVRRKQLPINRITNQKNKTKDIK